MKYLAILRDSFREAIDSKVIYVLVGLSLLVTLFLLSMSFTPIPAGEAFSALFGRNVLKLDDQEFKKEDPQFDLDGKGRRRWVDPHPRYKGVELLDGPADSPDSKYRVTFWLDLGSKEKAVVARQQIEDKIREIRNDLGKKVEEVELFKVTDVRVADRNTNAFARNAPAFERDEGVYVEMDTAPTPVTRRIWPTKVALFFGALPLSFLDGIPLGLGLYLLSMIVMWIGSLVVLLISVIITAFFIPNMLRKGTVDLLVVKPIHRWVLLVYKYIGGLTFVFLNTAVALLGIWLALGLRSGIWANSFLLMIFMITFFFAILYSISMLAAVMTRSAIVAILVTCMAWFVFFVIGTTHAVFDDQRGRDAGQLAPVRALGDNEFGQVVRAIHFVSPRTSELDALGSQFLLADFLTTKLAENPNVKTRDIHWAESISVSLAYMVLFIALSCWWFSTKDY